MMIRTPAVLRDRRVKAVILSVLDAMTFLLNAYCVLRFFTGTGDGNMQVSGFAAFRFFTVDSNVLASVACLAVLPHSIRAARTGELSIPAWVSVFKMIGTTAVTVTLLTVVFFLGPLYGYPFMFAGNNFFMHLLCPLFCIITFAFLETDAPVSHKYAFFGAIPTVIYGIVYLLCVVAFGVWGDFYGFNIGGFWYVSFIVMFFASVGLSYGLFSLHNLAARRAPAHTALDKK